MGTWPFRPARWTPPPLPARTDATWDGEIAPLPSSRIDSTQAVRMNGRRCQAIRCHISGTPKEVVDAYAGLLSASGLRELRGEPTGGPATPPEGHGFVRQETEGLATVRFQDTRGRETQVIAFLSQRPSEVSYLLIVTDSGAPLRGTAEEEDVPGEDPADVPRPVGSRRRLAMSSDAGTRVHLYEVAGSTDHLLVFYRDGLVRLGWEILRESAAGRVGEDGIFAVKEGRTCHVRITPTDEGKALSISVLYVVE